MLLAVDLGNSQVSFGIFDNSHLKFHWRLETKSTRTADEYASLLFPLLDRSGLSRESFSGVALCSVVPPGEHELELFFRHYFNLVPFKVRIDNDLGFKVNVDVPSEVGADRLANAAYACANLPLPCVVIDIGTATTFDVVTQEKSYEGGVIFPGVRLALDSLGTKTSKLPKVDLEFPSRAIGKNTVECIQAGVLLGYCDLIDGLLDRTEKELKAKPAVVLTGGFAFLFKDKLKRSTQVLPDLTLEGIRLLWERNKT